jgi:hypothetical protein
MIYLYWIILLLLFVITVLLYVLYKRSHIKRDEYVQDQYNQIYSLYGKPNYSVYEKSVWKNVSPFYDIILYNNGLDTDKQSVVVVGLTYNNNIPFDRLFTMFSVIKEVWYQQMEKVIFVRCDSIGRCVLLLESIYKYLTTNMSQNALQSQYDSIRKGTIHSERLLASIQYFKNKV